MQLQMKFLMGLSLAASAMVLPAAAQFKNGSQATELNLPRLSQRATVSQRVGLTDITIVYHRPTVNGRKIFGAAVPYGQVWRSGANENTVITFSDDVSVEGQALAAGTYGLHTIPDADHWTVVFSKNSTSWGSFTYDQKEDALRVTVKPQPGEAQEALAYTFDDVKPDSVAATLRWEKTAVPMHIAVDVKSVVDKSIQNQLRSTGGFSWAGFDEAALWNLDVNYKLDEAVKWSDQSIQIEERFDNLMTKSQVLEAMGKTQEAETAKKHALEIAKPLQLHIYARQLQRQKKQDEAFAIFRENGKKHPELWFAHGGLARIASAQGDFPTAVKEMKQAQALGPEANKKFLDALIDRLEKKEDINP